MSGIQLKIEQDDRKIRATLTQLIALGRNPAPAMEDLAVIGENTTRERFSTQLDPQGHRWKKSIRVQISGGKTLTKDGHLGDSITHTSSSKFSAWGTNMIYAAIHQNGGVIKPKNASSLRFRLAGGAFVSTKEVNMPKREFLGISHSDELDMLDALQARVNGVISHAS